MHISPLKPLSFLPVILCLVLFGCDTTTIINPQPITIEGVAAMGAPIPDAPVICKSKNGLSARATTDSDGNYTLDVATLTTPFLCRVPTADGALYSIADATGTANITPFTDLIVRKSNAAQGTDTDRLFQDFTATSTIPSKEKRDAIKEMVKTMIAAHLQSRGIEPKTFDPVTTPFRADRTGVDAILDRTEIVEEGATTTIVISDDTEIQTADITSNPLSGQTVSSVTTKRPRPPQPTVPVTPLPPTVKAGPRPKGIYVLDSKGGTLINGVSLRNANIRNLPFVTGYAWRQTWATFEKSEGVYDFTLIDEMIKKLNPIGKSLTILIGNAASEEPAYIAAKPGVATWKMVQKDGVTTVTRAVPWDPYLIARLQAFAKAMGDHQVPKPDGAMVPLRDHPLLVNVNFGLAGLGRVRDEFGNSIKLIPGYTRANLTTAVLAHLKAATDAFPNKFVEIGLWNVTDTTLTPPLWQHLTTQILDQKNPKVGLFQENLAASKNLTTGAITGTPSVAFAAPLLYPNKNATYTVLQALETWGASAKSTGTTPNDGIQYGYDTFGTEYFEIYVTDIDKVAYQADFQKWHDFFFKN